MSAIDPGIGDPIQDAAEDVEPDSDSRKVNYDPDKFRDETEEEDLMMPTSWWFASTASPLLAGTFGPIASGFNICALVQKWRVYIPPGGSEATGIPMADPPWLVGLNAVSLFCAVVGNVALLLNMARRLKFTIAQSLSISGFFLGGILLIVDVGAINASPTYFIPQARALPDANHALSMAYYFAIWAAAIYMVLGALMCATVYGANKGFYDKSFHLTVPQRTLMLQTMLFMAYILLGALVFCNIEGWPYLDAVYWADVTILTIGLGDYEPVTAVGRGLLFPFAIGGILIVGLVIGSIRSLVLERGAQKMSARITEKRRETAIHNVDERKQTIQISWLAKADFSTDSSLSPAQRREEEFKVMRKVQRAAERERRYFALAISLSFALMLWFVGAAIFMQCEKKLGWTYFQSLYFSFTSLLTIGYGDYAPASNSGRAFFVVWSLLAVPSLTILISNMGDTIVKGFSDLTVWIGYLTVLPGEGGARAAARKFFTQLSDESQKMVSRFSPPGLFGDIGAAGRVRLGSDEHQNQMFDRLAERLESHVQQDELDKARAAADAGDEVERDTHFYHYVLARELRNVQKDLSISPPKQYSWSDWEYFLKLMGNEEDPRDYPGQEHPDILVPAPLRNPQNKSDGPDDKPQFTDPAAAHQTTSFTLSPSTGSEATTAPGTDGAVDRQTELREQQDRQQKSKDTKSDQRKKSSGSDDSLSDWSWLSDKSPLMDSKSEAEWIVERLSAALERELNRQRKGYKRPPPISMKDAMRRGGKGRSSSDAKEKTTSSKSSQDPNSQGVQGADEEKAENVNQRLNAAAKGAS